MNKQLSIKTPSENISVPATPNKRKKTKKIVDTTRKSINSSAMYGVILQRGFFFYSVKRKIMQIL